MFKTDINTIGFLLHYNRDIKKHLVWIKPSDASIRINPESHANFEVPPGFMNATTMNDNDYAQVIGHVGNMRLNVQAKESRLRLVIEEWNIYTTFKKQGKATDDVTLKLLGITQINNFVSAKACDIVPNNDKAQKLYDDIMPIRDMTESDWNIVLCSLEMQYYTVRQMSDFLINCRVYMMIANQVEIKEKDKTSDGG